MAGAKQRVNVRGSMVKNVEFGGADQSIGDYKIVPYGNPGSKFIPIKSQAFDRAKFPEFADINTREYENAKMYFSELLSLLFIFSDASFYVSADGGVTWLCRSYQTSGVFPFKVTGIAESNDELVIVGTKAHLTLAGFSTAAVQSVALRTTNGVTFEEVELLSHATNGVTGVTYHIDKFISVFSGGSVKTSPTGATWTSRTSGTSSDISAITTNGTVATFVGAGGLIRTSPDGVTWTSRAVGGVTVDFASVAAKPSMTLAIGPGGIIVKSTNGTTFTNISDDEEFEDDWNAISYDSNTDKFVVRGRGEQGWSKTADGVAYSDVNLYDIDEENGYENVCHSVLLGKTFFCTAISDTQGKVVSSEDLTEFALVIASAELMIVQYPNNGITIANAWTRVEE